MEGDSKNNNEVMVGMYDLETCLKKKRTRTETRNTSIKFTKMKTGKQRSIMEFYEAIGKQKSERDDSSAVYEHIWYIIIDLHLNDEDVYQLCTAFPWIIDTFPIQCKTKCLRYVKENIHLCDICNFRFKDYNTLVKHRNKVHFPNDCKMWRYGRWSPGYDPDMGMHVACELRGAEFATYLKNRNKMIKRQQRILRLITDHRFPKKEKRLGRFGKVAFFDKNNNEVLLSEHETLHRYILSSRQYEQLSFMMYRVYKYNNFV